MTDPAPPGPDGPRPELLAAYADDELDPTTRAAVEAWLAAHPQALDALAAQRQLSPANWPLWQQAEPPRPSEAAWAGVRHAVADALTHPPVPVAVPRPWRRTGAWLAGGVAAAVAAAVVAWVAARPPAAPSPEPNPAPLPEVALNIPPEPDSTEPLPMASDADVEIERVAAADQANFPVGQLPLGGPLVLAAEEDVDLENVAEHPHWPSGGPVVVPAPGDAPMIFVTRPR